MATMLRIKVTMISHCSVTDYPQVGGLKCQCLLCHTFLGQGFKNDVAWVSDEAYNIYRLHLAWAISFSFRKKPDSSPHGSLCGCFWLHGRIFFAVVVFLKHFRFCVECVCHCVHVDWKTTCGLSTSTVWVLEIDLKSQGLGKVPLLAELSLQPLMVRFYELSDSRKSSQGGPERPH